MGAAPVLKPQTIHASRERVELLKLEAASPNGCARPKRSEESSVGSVTTWMPPQRVGTWPLDVAMRRTQSEREPTLQAGRAPKLTTNKTSATRRVREISSSRNPTTHINNPEHREDDNVDDDMLRTSVRQRIQQRVLELQSIDTVQKTATTPFMASLHQDVVHTAAQILGKYLTTTHSGDEPLELALVHRMLVKEVELQALQSQRTA